MSDRRPVVPEGLSAGTSQLAVLDGADRSGRNARRLIVMGLVWCSLGSALVPVAPVLANALVAFGAAVAMSVGGRREQVYALACGLVAGTLGTVLLFGAYEIPSTVLSVLAAVAVAGIVAGGALGTGGLIVGSAALALAMIGLDVVSTSLQGTTVTEVVTQVIDQAVEMSIGQLDLEGVAAVLEAKDSMVAMWPSIYFVVAAATVVCSLAGAVAGVRVGGRPVGAGMVSRYDVPLWVAEAFALGVVAQLLGPRLPRWQAEASALGANVVMCCRIVLVQQGLSVLQWWMRERRVPAPTRVLLVLVALWLEMSFALTSVAGILDVIVNFRRLERRRPDLMPRPAGER